VITVEMNDVEPLQRIRRCVGNLGRVRHRERVRPERGTTESSYIWSVYRGRDVRAIAETLLPWLGERKTECATAALTAIAGRRPRGGAPWNCPHHDRKHAAFGKCEQCYRHGYYRARTTAPARAEARVPDCHPDRRHHSRGLCSRCYIKAYAERRADRLKPMAADRQRARRRERAAGGSGLTRRPPGLPVTCGHPDRAHYALGKCKECYFRKPRRERPPASCHSDRPHFALGLCKRCYYRVYALRRKAAKGGARPLARD
jgi:hypothetical protein